MPYWIQYENKIYRLIGSELTDLKGNILPEPPVGEERIMTLMILPESLETEEQQRLYCMGMQDYMDHVNGIEE